MRTEMEQPLPIGHRAAFALAVCSVSLGVVARGERVWPGPVEVRHETQAFAATLLGQVVDGDSGRGLAGALVTVGAGGVGPTSTPRQQTISDDAGEFVVRGVEPGPHEVTATLAGYLPGAYGQRRPGGPPEPIDVAADRPVTRVALRLWKGGAVGGTVLDELGDPAVAVPVEAFELRTVDGRPRFSPVAAADTDDRGMYRIAGLIPGNRYIVGVAPTLVTVPAAAASWYRDALASGRQSRAELDRAFSDQQAFAPTGPAIPFGDQMLQVKSSGATARPRLERDGRLAVYSAVYHPSATTTRQAEAVVVLSGQDLAGVDVRLRLEPGFSIAGSVVGPDGPAARLRLTLSSSTDDAAAERWQPVNSETDPAGRFRLVGVPPGEYVLDVFRWPPPAPAGQPLLSVRQVIPVSDRDLEGVTLTLAPGTRVSGRVEFDGVAGPPSEAELKSCSVTLAPAGDLWWPIALPPASVSADGTFRTTSWPPGRYFVVPRIQDSRWAIQDVTLNGRSLVDQALDLAGADIDDVVIRFTDRAPEVRGRVRSRSGQDADAQVLLFPLDGRAWLAASMPPARVRVARVDPGEAFRFAGVPAGDYDLVAVPPQFSVDLGDPRELAKLAAAATHVHLAGNQHQDVSLVLTDIRSN